MMILLWILKATEIVDLRDKTSPANLKGSSV